MEKTSVIGSDLKSNVHIESVDGVHSIQRELADAAYHQCLVNLCVGTDNRAKFYGGTGPNQEQRHCRSLRRDT